MAKIKWVIAALVISVAIMITIMLWPKSIVNSDPPLSCITHPNSRACLDCVNNGLASELCDRCENFYADYAANQVDEELNSVCKASE